MFKSKLSAYYTDFKISIYVQKIKYLIGHSLLALLAMLCYFAIIVLVNSYEITFANDL